MPVAYNQIDEVLDIVGEFVHPKNRLGLFLKLKQTNAYKQNKSYAATIDRLIERYQDKKEV
jgi:hypothetical protein